MFLEGVIVRSPLNPDKTPLSFTVMREEDLLAIRIPAGENRDELIGLCATLEVSERIDLEIHPRNWEYESHWAAGKKSGTVYYVVAVTHYV